ncbi:MAG TPA: UDP-glucose 4-epimerase GalE [Candidatus Dormibacteraeota bacterium]|nr:UDP-glucose 4-epimerase GalE [Candidatus Dormibacteraeota bacterium]
MKVIVTGGAGYIGAHVTRALAEAGHAPIVVDDLRCASKERVGGHAHEAVACEDTAALADVFARHRPQGVVHLAGYISVGESVRDPDKYWGNNLAAAASLLIACTRHPVEVVLFSSTAAVYGNAEVSPIPERVALAPTSPYGASKLAFERLLHASAPAVGFRSAALRYFNAAGANPAWRVGEAHVPEEHLIPRVIDALLAGRPVQVYGDDYPTRDGTCERDYIHVTDLASAHLRVLEAGALASGVSFNVGTGHGHSVLQVIETIGRRLGRVPEIDILPRRPGDPASLVADPSALRAALGWEATHSGIEEIVDSAVDWELGRRG